MTARPNTRLSSQAMAFVLAGGRGSRLKELTDRRAKPAVYFGGKTRIIDFALSNALNSGIRKMAIATQYKAHSLIRHCQRGWNFFRAERNEYLDILPASQRVNENKWYLGTADAVTQNIDIVDSYGIKYVVILAGDHIYKMDYEIMLRQHVDSGADVTIGCLTVPRMEATAFGVMDVDKTGRITAFLEKPADPPSIPGDPDHALASMGIYIFNWDFLRDLLIRDAEDPNSSHDFGNDIIPDIVKNGKAMAHRFSESCVKSGLETEPYWRDVGTIDAFWQANIDLTDFVPKLDIYDNAWPIWTYAEIVPPAKFIHDEDGRRGSAVSSLVSGGCIVSGSEVRNSLLFTGVRTHSYSGAGICRGAAACHRQPQGAVEELRDRPRRGDPRGTGDRRGRGGRRAMVPPHRKRDRADHAGHAGCPRRETGLKKGRTVDVQGRVLSVASECVPLLKTGGLADVVGALPAALGAKGWEMRVLMPAYRPLRAAIADWTEVWAEADLFGGPGRVVAGTVGELSLLLLDAPHLYDREGGPYSGPGGDWPDNALRFAALSWAGAAHRAERLVRWLEARHPARA